MALKAVRNVVLHDPTAVVIIMSDHGGRLGLKGPGLADDLEQVHNFFAARTPGQQGLFGDAPTLVNVMLCCWTRTSASRS